MSSTRVTTPEFLGSVSAVKQLSGLIGASQSHFLHGAYIKFNHRFLFIARLAVCHLASLQRMGLSRTLRWSRDVCIPHVNKQCKVNGKLLSSDAFLFYLLSDSLIGYF